MAGRRRKSIVKWPYDEPADVDEVSLEYVSEPGTLYPALAPSDEELAAFYAEANGAYFRVFLAMLYSSAAGLRSSPLNMAAFANLDAGIYRRHLFHMGLLCIPPENADAVQTTRALVILRQDKHLGKTPDWYNPTSDWGYDTWLLGRIDLRPEVFYRVVRNQQDLALTTVEAIAESWAHSQREVALLHDALDGRKTLDEVRSTPLDKPVLLSKPQLTELNKIEGKVAEMHTTFNLVGKDLLPPFHEAPAPPLPARPPPKLPPRDPLPVLVAPLPPPLPPRTVHLNIDEMMAEIHAKVATGLKHADVVSESHRLLRIPKTQFVVATAAMVERAKAKQPQYQYGALLRDEQPFEGAASSQIIPTPYAAHIQPLVPRATRDTVMATMARLNESAAIALRKKVEARRAATRPSESVVIESGSGSGSDSDR